MKSRAVERLNAFVTFYCVTAIAFASIIPKLHQAFADHYHVFCLDHHQIEDAGSKRNSLETTDISSNPHIGKGAAFDGIDQRQACFFSNTVVQQANRTPSTQRSVEIIDRKSEAIPTIEVVVSSIEIVLFAPKHSPPFTA